MIGGPSKIGDGGSSVKKRSNSKNNTAGTTGQLRNSHIRSFSTRQDNFTSQNNVESEGHEDNTRKSGGKGYQSLKRTVDEIYIQSSSTTPQKRQSNIASGSSAIKSKNPFG